MNASDGQKIHIVKCDNLGKLQVDVIGGVGGDATAANQATQILVATDINIAVTSLDSKITKGNDTTLNEAQQVLCYGEVTSGPGTGELHPIHITQSGDVEVEIADFVKGQDIMAASFPVVIASDQSNLTVDGTVSVTGNVAITATALPLPTGASTETTLNDINNKIIKGNDATLVEAQQVGSYAINESTGLFQPLSAHHSNKSLKITNANITKGNDATLVEAQQVLVYGCDFTGDLRPLKIGDTGRLIVEVDGIRKNGSEIGWTIANGTTGTSTEILMNTHTRIAFYGDTDNTFNANFFIEYSQDGVSWFRGSDENAKVIIISASGNFYDEEIITPPRVRLSRTNNGGSLETINLYWTQL